MRSGFIPTPGPRPSIPMLPLGQLQDQHAQGPHPLSLELGPRVPAELQPDPAQRPHHFGRCLGRAHCSWICKAPSSERISTTRSCSRGSRSTTSGSASRRSRRPARAAGCGPIPSTSRSSIRSRCGRAEYRRYPQLLPPAEPGPGQAQGKLKASLVKGGGGRGLDWSDRRAGGGRLPALLHFLSFAVRRQGGTASAALPAGPVAERAAGRCRRPHPQHAGGNWRVRGCFRVGVLQVGGALAETPLPPLLSPSPSLSRKAPP